MIRTLEDWARGTKAVTPLQDKAGSGLSANQVETLEWLLKCAVEADSTAAIPWKHPQWTACQRASVSRSLRRLEARGLIERFNLNGESRRKTSHITLTVPGLRVLGIKGLTTEMLTVSINSNEKE